jgi:hypothetical protein
MDASNGFWLPLGGGGDKIGGLVSSNRAPGATVYKKVCRSLFSLSNAGRGTLFTFGGAQEIMLFADEAVEVTLGNSTAPLGSFETLHLYGEIGNIWVRKLQPWTPGRLVLFFGQPYLGINFKREEPTLLNRWRQENPLPLVWAGGAGFRLDNATLLTAPTGTGLNAESWYLWSFYAERDAGVIDYVELVENETGGNVRLERLDNSEPATGRLRFRAQARPIRLANGIDFRFVGSVEAGATGLSWAVVVSYV